MRPIRTATSLALIGLVAALLSLVAAPVLAAPFTNTPGSGAARTAFGAAQGSEDSPDDGADHAEMEMTDTEMAEEGHDLDGAEHAEDAEIVDPDGATGWMNKSLLTGVRTGFVRDQVRTLYVAPDLQSRVAWRIEPGSVVAITLCENQWCRVSNDGRSGYILRSQLWGTYPGEVIGG